MSLSSMTGYGRGAATTDGLTIVVELSSVNRKQLDLHINLPRGLGVLEARVAEEIQHVVSRGRVTMDVSVRWSGAARRKAIRIDEDLADTYIKALRKTARSLGLKDDLSADLLLTLPEVVRFAQPEEDIEKIWSVLARSLHHALRELRRMRMREGRALQRDVQKRLGLLNRMVTRVARHAPSVAARYRRTLLRRLEQSGLAWEERDERVLREIALFADRSDVSEEITRLQSHLDQFARLTRSKQATGRSMDFLAQEMLREINTIGSKANDASILKGVVAFKAELERIREQIQNVE